MKTPAQIENIIKIIKRNYKSTQMERAALLSAMLLSLCIFPHHAQAMQAEETGGDSLLPVPTGNRLLEIQRDIESNAVMENYNDMQQAEETGGGSLLPAPTGNRLLEIQRYIESDADIENYNDRDIESNAVMENYNDMQQARRNWRRLIIASAHRQ